MLTRIELYLLQSKSSASAITDWHIVAINNTYWFGFVIYNINVEMDNVAEQWLYTSKFQNMKNCRFGNNLKLSVHYSSFQQ